MLGSLRECDSVSLCVLAAESDIVYVNAEQSNEYRTHDPTLLLLLVLSNYRITPHGRKNQRTNPTHSHCSRLYHWNYFELCMWLDER